jgi:uridine phosphorylase
MPIFTFVFYFQNQFPFLKIHYSKKTNQIKEWMKETITNLEIEGGECFKIKVVLLPAFVAKATVIASLSRHRKSKRQS